MGIRCCYFTVILPRSGPCPEVTQRFLRILRPRSESRLDNLYDLLDAGRTIALQHLL